MRRMGIEKDEMSGHGFRAMARTILDEVLGFRPDFIEHQLAHADKGAGDHGHRSAWNVPGEFTHSRSIFLRERRGRRSELEPSEFVARGGRGTDDTLATPPARATASRARGVRRGGAG